MRGRDEYRPSDRWSSACDGRWHLPPVMVSDRARSHHEAQNTRRANKINTKSNVTTREFQASAPYLRPKMDVSKNAENANPSGFSGRTIKIRSEITVSKNGVLFSAFFHVVKIAEKIIPVATFYDERQHALSSSDAHQQKKWSTSRPIMAQASRGDLSILSAYHTLPRPHSKLPPATLSHDESSNRYSSSI